MLIFDVVSNFIEYLVFSQWVLCYTKKNPHKPNLPLGVFILLDVASNIVKAPTTLGSLSIFIITK